MPLKPRVKVKAPSVPVDEYEGKGIPIGNFEVVTNAAGKHVIRPKRKPKGQTLNQQYASKNRKKWKAAK